MNFPVKYLDFLVGSFKENKSKEVYLKILVTGAFSTGKTSLIVALANVLSDKIEGQVAIRVDPARECPLPLNRAQQLATSTWIAGRILTAEAEAVHCGASLILCDRGFPDVLSHTPQDDLTDTDLDIVETLWNTGQMWAHTYEHVFWARPDPQQPIITDGVRVPDDSYREELDLALKIALDRMNISPIILPHPLNERIQIVLSKVLS